MIGACWMLAMTCASNLKPVLLYMPERQVADSLKTTPAVASTATPSQAAGANREDASLSAHAAAASVQSESVLAIGSAAAQSDAPAAEASKSQPCSLACPRKVDRESLCCQCGCQLCGRPSREYHSLPYTHYLGSK